jgi:hypothetical protein
MDSTRARFSCLGGRSDPARGVVKLHGECNGPAQAQAAYLSSSPKVS